MDDPRRPLREFEDRALRLVMGGYDWTLLPLNLVQDALRLMEGEIITVRVPGVNGEFTAHRAFVQRLVETRSSLPQAADGDHERNPEGAPEFR